MESFVVLTDKFIWF